MSLTAAATVLIASAPLVSASASANIFTRPYTPHTKAKAERFIQTSLREWAYAAIYSHSAHRAAHRSERKSGMFFQCFSISN